MALFAPLRAMRLYISGHQGFLIRCTATEFLFLIFSVCKSPFFTEKFDVLFIGFYTKNCCSIGPRGFVILMLGAKHEFYIILPRARKLKLKHAIYRNIVVCNMSG